MNGQTGPLNADCISGHVPLWCWHLYEGAGQYARVTLFRDPWHRVVSHINWVNQYNMGEPLPKHGPGAADLAAAVGHISDTDFDDRASLMRLFDAIKRLKLFTSFDNYQVRMMRIGAMNAMEKRLTAHDVDVACDALASFTCFGFCEDQTSFQHRLLAQLDLAMPARPILKNPAKTKILTPDNSLAHQIFAPWFEKDQALIGYAKGKLAQT